MFKENKQTDRPKVRFSQPPSSSSSFSFSSNTKENFDKIKQTITNNKPRVRSVINLDDKSKIIYNRNGELITGDKIIDDENIVTVEKKKQSLFAESDKDDERKKTSNRSPPKDDEKVSLKKKLYDDNESEKKSANKIIDPSKKDENITSSCENNRKESKKSDITKESKNGAKIYETKISSSKILKSTPTPLVKKLTKKSSPSPSSSSSIVIKDNSSKFCYGLDVKTKTSLYGKKNIKPCMKTAKTIRVIKNDPVKKILLRDVSVGSTEFYVRPGVTRYYPQTFRGGINDETEDARIRGDILAGEKLGRPEYNSITCTIEELKRVKSEKFVTDVERLPLFYKNLLNEKVSAALDFPPDQTIYKNLIEISINDDQLPSRLKRSKDPEPRNRDITPRLSDFFNPIYSQEYCYAVNIKPVIPDTISNWSAFVISDKIFAWKHDMDRFS